MQHFGSGRASGLSRYGDEGTRNMLFRQVVGYDRNDILRAYSDPDLFALPLRCVFHVNKLAEGSRSENDLRSIRRFAATVAMVRANPAAQRLVDQIVPRDLKNVHLPLLPCRPECAEIVRKLASFDHGFEGRVLLLNALAALARDCNLVPDLP